MQGFARIEQIITGLTTRFDTKFSYKGHFLPEREAFDDLHGGVVKLRTIQLHGLRQVRPVHHVRDVRRVQHLSVDLSVSIVEEIRLEIIV